MTNFDFLKNIDKDLFTIASIAEKLYRDEYFEQCMGQTRRFAENAVKRVLGKKAPYDATFDELINTLKDHSKGNAIEKEFIDDLYFLKKAGNISVHGATVKKDGITALECLRRMFEVAINYAVHLDKTNANLLKLSYDEELLLLGRPKQEKTLQEKYAAAKELFEQKNNNPNVLPKKTTKKTKSSKKIKTETFVPEKKSTVKSTIKNNSEEKTQKNSKSQKRAVSKKVSAVKKVKAVAKRKTSNKKTSGLPLFLNPVVIFVSFLFGAIVLVFLALQFKIL